MDIKLIFSYCIPVGLGAFIFTIQLIYPSNKSGVYEVDGGRGRGGGAEFKKKRKVKMIGIIIRMFINRNFGFFFKMQGGFM